jgi:hypothetical protein
MGFEPMNIGFATSPARGASALPRIAIKRVHLRALLRTHYVRALADASKLLI